jgi:hypothetical protein
MVGVTGMNRYPRDQHGDPRDYATEAQAILDGTLPMRPSQEHLCEVLQLTIGHVPDQITFTIEEGAV